MRIPALPLACALLLGCASAPERVDPFSHAWTPPLEVRTERVVLEPLQPSHAELDHAALIANRAHLRRTLAWGDWPSEGFTVEQNRRDLARHWLDFNARAGYAYTVLAPDRSRVLGCVYLEPADPRSEIDAARFFYWVIEPEIASDLDVYVARLVLATFAGAAGPFDRLVLPVLRTDARGLAVARELGLERAGERGDRVLFLHRAPGSGA